MEGGGEQCDYLPSELTMPCLYVTFVVLPIINMKTFFTALLLVSVFTCQIYSDTVTTIYFGEMELQDNGDYIVTETTKIEAKTKDTGYRLGFAIQSDDKSDFDLRFEWHAPSKARGLLPNPENLARGDRAISENIVISGEIQAPSEHFELEYFQCDRETMINWSGKWTLWVFVNGNVEHVIDFTVHNDEAEQGGGDNEFASNDT